MLICAGGSADPESGTPKSPSLVSRVSTPPKTCTKSPEDPGGEKSTVKLTLAPGPSVPSAGGLVTAKGNAGALKPVMVTGLAETLVNLTGRGTVGPPMGWAAKSAALGEALI